MVSIQYCSYGSVLRGDKRSMTPCKHVYCWNTNLCSQMYWSKVKSWLWASVLQLSVNLYNLHLIDSIIWLLWLTLLAWNCVIKTPLLCRMVIFFSNVKFIHITLNQHTTDILGICLYPIANPFPSPSVRWSSHPWTRRATPMCRGLWSRVRRPREESTPSTRPLFSNIDPPCPLLCVCAFQRLPFTGAPPRSWAQATHAAASPHRLKKQNVPPRPR